jgi:transcriptional regulator with XRE-family HTH domain
MDKSLDYAIATSKQTEQALCGQIRAIRLSRNITQEQLANDAGLSLWTISNLERGQGVSLDTFIRVLMALGIQQNLAALLPDPTIRPMERIDSTGTERQRARPEKPAESPEPWTWGDEVNEDE